MILVGLCSCGCRFESPPTNGFLGIILVDPSGSPLVVQGFVPDSPAATSGLLEGDALLRIGRQRDPPHDQLLSVVEQLRPGDDVGIRVARGNDELEYLVELVSSDFIERAMQQQSDTAE